jgi:nucleotide-binding universal stress UspA family protein
MNPLKRILVCLDLSELDETLVEFANIIATGPNVERVYFLNVVKDVHVPEAVLKEFPDMLDNALNERREKIQSLVDAKLSLPADINGKVKVQVLVKHGLPPRKILQMVEDSNIDIIVAGKKTRLQGTGVVVQRLARRASCNLLIVPEGSRLAFDKVLVPSDFSDNSRLALNMAIDIISRRNKEKGKVIVQNVFTVPAGYHYSGKSFGEFAEIMKKHARKEYRKFIKEINTKGVNVKDTYSNDVNDNQMSDIYDKAVELDVDGIVMGAKGRTAATALFLGSIAERAIQMNHKYPLFIVRPKGQNAGIWDFIKDI